MFSWETPSFVENNMQKHVEFRTEETSYLSRAIFLYVVYIQVREMSMLIVIGAIYLGWFEL